MKRTLSIFCILLFFPLIGIGETYAQNSSIVTRCTTDVESGGGDLSSALALGGPIVFECGGSGIATIRITRTHQINRTVTLRGEGKITLDMQGTVRAFDMINPAATLTLERMIVRGAPKLVIPAADHSVTAGFIRNTVGATIRLISGKIEGNRNSIYNVGGQVHIEKMWFSNSRDVLVNRGGNVKISDSDFNNQGEMLNGTFFEIDNDGGVMEILNSDFAGLRPLVSVISNSGTLTIVGSRFTQNKTRQGVISARGSGSVTIKDSQFHQNSSNTAGGVLSGAGEIHIQNSQFIENSAVECGGALFIVQVPPFPIDIRGSTFEGNLAKCGGAIEIETEISPETALVAIDHTKFIKNRATESGGALGIGVQEESAQINGLIVLRNAIFSENRAQYFGGAIAAQNVGLHIEKSVFVKNHAGEAAAAIGFVSNEQSPASHLANSLIVGNSTTETGGVLLFQSLAPISIINSTIMDNSNEGAKGESTELLSGAALISFSSNEIQLANTIIANNMGGNCEGDGFVDAGHNLQFPNGCLATITVADPRLTSRYMPTALSPARGAGDKERCATSPVNGQDLFGEKRGVVLPCTIGAIEKKINLPVKER